MFACDSDSTSHATQKNKEQVTDYVLRPGLKLPFSTDTLALIAKTVGKPISFSDGSVRFVDKETVYKMPFDSLLFRIDKPSYFRNPEEKLAGFFEGDDLEKFSYDLYNPYPDTWVDSVSLADYSLDYDYEDMSSVHKDDKMYSHLKEGNASLVIRNQCQREVVAFELEAELKKRIKSGTSCVVKPFFRTFTVEKSIPPFTQISTIVQSDSLTMDLVCKSYAKYFEVPYKAEFKILRFQVKGDTTWIDARQREIIVD